MDLFQEFSEDELKITDIQFLGLKQKAWDFTRGMRTSREYHYPNDSVAVEDIYGYTFSDDNRSIKDMTRVIRWYNAASELKLEVDVTPELNIKNLKELNRDIRQGRIDYMVGAAEELINLAPFLPEPYATDFVRASHSIGIILKQYELEITHYVASGSLEFENVVNNEDNPIMMELLGLLVRPPDAIFPTGLNIKQSILHQLTGSY